MSENFLRSRWGAFIHFLGKRDMTAAEWNARTAAFDAEGLAAQLADAGARWLFFTMGQASGHYAAPNAYFDSVAGGADPDYVSKCSTRDLPSELGKALLKRGIRLCLYMPSEAPNCPNFGWRFNRRPDGSIIGDRLAEFQQKWEAVIREWSLRYGKTVSAWWVDSCYFADAMYRFPDPPNFASFAAALRAGNPDALLAFNPGIRIPAESLTDEDDYTAGELATSLPTAFDRFPIGVKSPAGFVPLAELGDRPQYHLLCSLGRDWGHLVKTDAGIDICRFPAELVYGYTAYILNMGGAMTWELPVGYDGRMFEPVLEQLRRLRHLNQD
ncbi:MAG: alpha-L-fucosidase [Clostridiales bacterium]|nr:alpha-L-fucosidase [Clostridiales bacterium]